MNLITSEQLFTQRNLTAEVPLASVTVGAIAEPAVLHADLLLGRTGGRLAGGYTTYTITVEVVRTVGGSSETFRQPPRRILVMTAPASMMVPLAVHVQAGDVVRVLGQSSSTADTTVAGALWSYDASSGTMSTAAQSAMLASLLGANVDTTGHPLTLAKAMEAMLAVLAGNATFDTATGMERFLGRDGTTPVVTLALTGNGTRGESTVL